MRKLFKLILCSVMALGSICSVPFVKNDVVVNAAVEGTKGLVIDTKGVLTGYVGTDTDIVIPDGVTTIGAEAFENLGITSVIIPDSVTEIGNYAFSNCKNLKSVDLGTGVTTLGYYAFKNTTALKEIFIPKSMYNCDDSLTPFLGSGIEKVTFEEGIARIPALFSEVKGITSIKIPNSAKTICNYAFSDCTNLKSVDLGSGVTKLGYKAFANTSSLKEITIPKSLTSCSAGSNLSPFYGSAITKVVFEDGSVVIANGIMSEAKKLIDVIIPESVFEIREGAFEGCSSLQTVEIPDSVRYIEENAFKNCVNLSNVKLSNELYSLGYDVFYGCQSLISINIPKSLNSVNYIYGTFAESGLKDVTFEEGTWKIPSYLFYGAKKLTNITLPDTLYIIGSGVFEKSGLTSVTIPVGTRYINSEAFASCLDLEKVDIPKTVKSISNNSFDKSLKVTFHVAKNSYAESYADSIGMPHTVTVAPEKPTKLVTTVTDADKVELSWFVDDDADKTVVYYREIGADEWIKSGSTSKSSFVVSGLTPAVKYEFRAKSYVKGAEGNLYSSYSDVVTATPNFGKVSKIKVEQTSSSGSVKITWSKVLGAKYYQLYRSTSETGKYSKVKTFSENTRSYTNTGMSGDKTYFYKLRGYTTINDKKYYSKFGSVVSIKPITVSTVSNVSVAKANTSGSAVKISWNKSEGAKYYQVYRSTSESGTYKSVKTLSNSYTSFTNTSLTKGKTYYFKVRGYKTVEDMKVYSKFSKIVSYTYK